MSDDLTVDVSAETLAQPSPMDVIGYERREGLKIYNEAELAAMLELKPHTLMQWRAENKGPDYTKLGRSVFYRHSDLMEWIARNVQVVNRVG